MRDTKTDWVAIIGSPVIALFLLYVLRWFLPSGMALAIALTTGMAWGHYRTTRRFDFAVIPVSIALAFGVAQFFPREASGPIAVLFGVAPGLIALWLRDRWPPPRLPNEPDKLRNV